MRYLRKSDPMKIFHFCANHTNIGDRISADGIMGLLHRKFPQDQYTRLFCDKQFVEQCTQAVEQQYTDDDLIVVGGGGLLIQYFMPFWRWLFGFRDRRARYILWGLGVCENYRLTQLDSTDLDVLRTVLGNSLATSVRDKVSHDFCSQLGPAVQIGCPAHVAVASIRGQLECSDQHLLYVNHSDLTMVDEVGRINEIMRAHGEGIGTQTLLTCNNIMDPNMPVVEYLKTYYQSAKVIVTTRLHGAIIGLSLGKPVVIISKDTKLNSYFSRFELDSFITNSIDNLPRLLADVEYFPDVRHNVAEIVNRNVHMSDEIADRLLEI